jgi:toxin ParE1/3/4
VSLALRWTEHAVNQLGALAEYIALVSPVYAEQTIDRIVARLRQAQDFPESGRRVAEAPLALELRELIELPYRLIYQPTADAIVVIAIVHGKQDFPRDLPG